jgi:hypothetical protein
MAEKPTVCFDLTPSKSSLKKAGAIFDVSRRKETTCEPHESTDPQPCHDLRINDSDSALSNTAGEIELCFVVEYPS